MACFTIYLLPALLVPVVYCQLSSQRCKLHYTKDGVYDVNNENNFTDGKIHFKPSYYIEYEPQSHNCVCDTGRCLLKCCPIGQTVFDTVYCGVPTTAFSYTFTIHNVKQAIGTRDYTLAYANKSECASIDSNTYLQEDDSIFYEDDGIYLPKTVFCWDINEYGKPVQWECEYNSTQELPNQGTVRSASTYKLIGSFV